MYKIRVITSILQNFCEIERPSLFTVNWFQGWARKMMTLPSCSFSLLGQCLLPSESLVWGWGFPQNWSQGHELSPGQGPADLDFPEARGFGVHFRQPSFLEIFGVIDSKSLLVSGSKAHRSPAGHCDAPGVVWTPLLPKSPSLRPASLLHLQLLFLSTQVM